jgi:phage protein D
MGLIDFRPLVRVTINGTPLSGFIFSAISSVRVTDAAGFISDTAEITFSNVSALNRFVMPEPGAEIEIAMGYLFGFRSMGLYIADEIEESDPPRQITVVCRAKSQGVTSTGIEPISQQKTRTWAAGLTLKEIGTTIAENNGLKQAITDEAAAIVPGHIDQVDESDIAVLTRIAAQNDLIAKPAGGHLFIGRRGAAVTASGDPMPVITLRRPDVTRWRMRRSLGDAVGTVIATYRDLQAGADIEVKVGDGEPVRRLRQRFRSKDEARVAAASEARRASRSVEGLEIEMPGNPSVVAEAKLVVIGFSSAASGDWVVETATHEITEAGYQTSISAKRAE